MGEEIEKYDASLAKAIHSGSVEDLLEFLKLRKEMRENDNNK